MIIGYARVSREDQDLGRQIKALTEAGCQKNYQDKISGAKAHRPELEKMFSELADGDVVVVQKLDRLGRSLKHLIEIVMSFKEKGVGFRSLTEGFDTTTPSGTMIFHVIGAIAQFERELISERTKNALAFKRSQGVRLGRPEVDDRDLVRRFEYFYKTGMDRDRIQAALKISEYKYYALRKQIKNAEVADKVTAVLERSI